MPIFTNPAAMWGTLIFLGLIVVYLYRRRSRNYVVSSLMFFAKSKSTAEGGQKIHKLQMPFIFFIEFLILLFFILALANPMNLQKGKLVPITVVLDDSVSMTAGGGGFSPKSQAVSFLEKNVFSEKLYRITLVKTGKVPRLIGRRDMNGKDALEALRENWNCQSVASDIGDAVAHGISISSEDAAVIVVTDHLKTDSINENIKWLSFGRPLENIAITAANRTANGHVDRCFFEFTNFSDKSKKLEAEIIDLASGNVLENINSNIEAGSSRRSILKFKEQNAAVKAVLRNDAVEYDNEAVLLPIKRKKLKVDVRLKDKNLAIAVKKAVKSTELAVINSTEPELLICDRNFRTSNDQLLTKLIIHTASQPVLLRNAIAYDNSHEITTDLPIENYIWAADGKLVAKGEILVAAGNTPLLWIENDNNNYATVVMNYSFNSSNMHKSSFWPVLFYNIIDWTSQKVLGPNNFNFRSGSKIEVYADKAVEQIYIANKKNPEKKEVSSIQNGKAVFIAGESGLYEITAGETKYDVSINLCSYDESDLTKAAWKVDLPKIISDENMSHFESVKWWFIIIAFLLMLLHQWLIARGRSGYAF